MPTYQYSCTECGHAFEQFQSFSEDSLTSCPRCEGRLRKIFNAVGVVFKGSGFYRNDSRTGAAKDAGSGTSGAGTSGADKDAGGPSKPAPAATPAASGPSSAPSSSASSSSAPAKGGSSAA